MNATVEAPAVEEKKEKVPICPVCGSNYVPRMEHWKKFPIHYFACPNAHLCPLIPSDGSKKSEVADKRA